MTEDLVTVKSSEALMELLPPMSAGELVSAIVPDALARSGDAVKVIAIIERTERQIVYVLAPFELSEALEARIKKLETLTKHLKAMHAWDKNMLAMLDAAPAMPSPNELLGIPNPTVEEED